MEAPMCGGITRERWGEGNSRKLKKGIGVKRNAARGPAVTAEALATIRGLPAAPAVDNAGFDPGIILPGAGKVGVEVLDLDQPQGDMFGHFVVGPASQSHCEGVGSAARAAKVLP